MHIRHHLQIWKLHAKGRQKYWGSLEPSTLPWDKIVEHIYSQEANSENVLIFHFLKKLWVEAGNIA